jgi:S-adenosylmethionine synthetase
MAVRAQGELDVTAAVPFHPERVPDWPAYQERLKAIHGELTAELKRFLDGTPLVGEARLCLNTKDVPGRGYLTPFGTSLGKGDCGAVAEATATTG